MSNLIKIKRGLKERLPNLIEGELGFTTDTKQFYIGSNEGNIEIYNKSVINGLIDEVKSLIDLKSKNITYLSQFPRLPLEINDNGRLQRALDKSTKLFLNEKEINISTRIVIRSNTEVYGIPNVTTIKASDDMGSIVMLGNSGDGRWDNENFISASENIIVKDIILDGNRDNRNLGNNPNAHTLSFIWCKNLIIENVTVKNSNGASILLYNCLNAIVNNNLIYDSGSNGILCMQKCKNIWVTNNFIDKTLAQNGIFFMYQNNLSSVNTFIINNVVNNSYDFGIEVGDHVAEIGQPHLNTHIINNKVYNSNNAGISCRTANNAFIVGNIIEGFGKSTGYGTEGIFCEGENKLCNNLIIKDNIISQFLDNTGAKSGIFITGYLDFIIDNNIIKNCKNHAINIEASSTTVATSDFPDKKRIVSDFKIKNNIISNCIGRGIRVSGYNTKNIEVKDNNIKNCTLQGVEITGQNSLNLFSIDNNIISECGKSAILTYLLKNGSISNNKCYNNSLTGINDDEKSTIRISSNNNIVLANNILVDEKTEPSQKYYLTVNNSNKVFNHYNVANVGGVNQYSNTDYKVINYV